MYLFCAEKNFSKHLVQFVFTTLTLKNKLDKSASCVNRQRRLRDIFVCCLVNGLLLNYLQLWFHKFVFLPPTLSLSKFTL